MFLAESLPGTLGKSSKNDLEVPFPVVKGHLLPLAPHHVGRRHLRQIKGGPLSDCPTPVVLPSSRVSVLLFLPRVKRGNSQCPRLFMGKNEKPS